MVTFDPETLADWCGGAWSPQAPDTVHGINHDSRTCEAGNLYVALVGERFDGHDFVDAARECGACGAMVSASWAGTPDAFPLLRVPDPATGLRDMAARYRQELNPGIIGVTGSAGKTSVKELTAHMLAQARPTAKSLGNWNNDIGIPLSLLAMPGDTQAAVFEVGTNHPGEIASLCDLLKPGDGILTNIGAAHIENFGSIEAIAEEKSALLKCLSPIGIAVLDAESEYFDQLAAAVPGRVVTVAKQGNADYTILARDEQLREVEIGEQETGEKISIPIDPFSEYQVSNVMLSVAMARAHQVDWEQIRQAVEEYQPLPMRWQREWVREVLMINDAYNANPLNMRAAIDAFRDEQHQGAKWLVLGEMQELGDHARTEHRMLGEYLASGTWSGLIVVGNGAAGIGDGAASAGMERGAIYHCEDSAAAAETLGAALSPGDAVMVKGSRGARMESVITEFKQGD